MGGEITWTCQGNAYVFHVKFYRDCTGIPGMTSVSLENNAGVAPILCSLVSQTDISPTGSVGSGNLACPICAAANTNAVEEFVYQSTPITIPGTPPVTGWAFWFGSCCRSGLLTNVSGAGNIGFALRTKMYPFNGFIPGQCTDASPYFAEKPSVIICTGYPFTYNHLAVDAEMDSLVYSWDTLITDASYPWQVIPFAPGYSVTSQMPSTLQNPSNIPASLNPQNGQLSFRSFTPGYFATAIRVSSYKCGQLASEITREINIVLINGCVIPVTGNPPNNPPVAPAPFLDSLGVPTYETFVYAGDSLSFSFVATDADPHPLVNNQTVTINASGQQFGAGFTDTTSGCLIPPCATLTPPPPLSSSIGISTQFNWNTTPAHLGLGLGCVYFGNKYFFVLKAKDDYCPANAITNQTITVTVLPTTPVPPVINNGGTLICMLTGNYSYQWFLDRFAIAGATSQSVIPTAVGFYQVLAINNATGDGNYSTGINITTVGVDEMNENVSNFSLTPNPSYNGKFNLSFYFKEKENIKLTVKDILGTQLKEITFDNFSGKYSEELNLSGFTKGIYFIEIKTAWFSTIKKVIIL